MKRVVDNRRPMKNKSIVGAFILVVLLAVGCIITWLALSSRNKVEPTINQRVSSVEIPSVDIGRKVAPVQPAKSRTPSKPDLGDKSRVPVLDERTPPQANLKPALKVPDWISLPSPFKLIAGQAEEKGLEARLTAVHNLGKSLSPKEIEALYWFLGNRLDKQAGLDNLSFNAIKNDILDGLIAQQKLPPDLGDKLIQYFRDKTMDVTWRDYCVQHFSIYYETQWGRDDANRLTAPGRSELMSAYYEALAEPGNGIAGTALVGLERLSTLYPEINRQQLGEKALGLAKDGRSDVQTKIAAINVCGETGTSAILPMARINAQTAEVLPLRLASIAAIGQVGTAEDRELLESLLAGTDNSVHKAATVALKKLGQH